MSLHLFNTIAPVYGLFYDWQKKHYHRIFTEVLPFQLKEGASVLDVGCGTGALASMLCDLGHDVIGVDQSERMLAVARKHNPVMDFRLVDVNEGLPFAKKQFDYSITSYVAHGLRPSERLSMYHEMSRVSSGHVLIFDYNDQRALLTSIVEWMEGGDYFRFIRQAAEEMRTVFSDVKVYPLGGRAALYHCTP